MAPPVLPQPSPPQYTLQVTDPAPHLALGVNLPPPGPRINLNPPAPPQCAPLHAQGTAGGAEESPPAIPAWKPFAEYDKQFAQFDGNPQGSCHQHCLSDQDAEGDAAPAGQLSQNCWSLRHRSVCVQLGRRPLRFIRWSVARQPTCRVTGCVQVSSHSLPSDSPGVPELPPPQPPAQALRQIAVLSDP